MNGAQSARTSSGTGLRPLGKTACFTRLTSPIQENTPGYASSRRSIPARTEAGRERSGKVIDNVR